MVAGRKAGSAVPSTATSPAGARDFRQSRAITVHWRPAHFALLDFCSAASANAAKNSKNPPVQTINRPNADR
jgi:hypothetical protein